MTMHVRPRGLIRARADATDPKAVLTALNTAFAEFKATNDERIKGVEKRFDDVVTRDKLDKVNSAVSDAQKVIDEINAKLAALTVGGGSGAPVDPAKAEHSRAFNRWFRKGVDNGLADLEVKAGLSTNSDPDGGFVVPVEMESTIDRVLSHESAVRSLATVRTISTQTYKKMINVGGAGSGWVGETDARPETATPQLRGLEFSVHELYANPATTQTALDDAALDVAAWLASEVSIEFGEQEGRAFVEGEGVHSPRGFLSYDKVANSAFAWGKLGFVNSGGAAGFDASDPGDSLIDLVHALRRQYRRNGVWLMNDMSVQTVRKFKDAEGNYMWQASLQVGQPSQLLGYRVETDDFMPDIAADSFPIAFGDFRRGYLVLDRQGIRVLRDPFTSKPNVHFYTTKRVGGGVTNFEAIKLMKIAAA